MKKHTLGVFLCVAYPLLGHAEGLLAVDNPARNGQQQMAYAAIDAFEADDQVALRQYNHDWQGAYSRRNGKNLGVLSARAESGAQRDGYRLGALYRAETLVEANRDSSDFLRQYKNNSGYDIGRTYQIDARIKGFEATGARLSKSFQINPPGHWQVDGGIGLSYLHGKRLRLETATGQAVTLNSKDFNADASLDETNSQININNLAKFNPPFGQLSALSGQGYALDAGMVLRDRASGFSLDLAVADLAGRLNWKNLPNNVTDYNNATKFYDADGFVHFNPLATRSSSYRDLKQKLDPKWRVAGSYPIGDFEVQGAGSFTTGYWFPQAGIKYRITSNWAVNADYDFRFNSVGISIQHQYFHVGLRTDSTSMDRAKACALNGGVAIPF